MNCQKLLFAVCIVILGLVCLTQSRYLPTRERIPTEQELKKLLQQVSASGQSHRLVDDDAQQTSNALVEQEGNANVDDTDVALSDLKANDQKRLSYQFICFDKWGRYRMCSKRYRRK